MFAIAFDLKVEETVDSHPRGLRQAYIDMQTSLARFKFTRVQGSVYVSADEDLTKVVQAMNALRAMPWFALSVRDVRAFRIEQWSDFTTFTKGTD